MDELVTFILTTTSDLLTAGGVPKAAAERLIDKIVRNELSLPTDLAAELIESGVEDATLLNSLIDVLAEVGLIVPYATRETMSMEDLESSAASAERAAAATEAIRAFKYAYNYYEIAWHLGGIIDRPALAVALKLRQLSNPANVDQYHSAIWRLAIERLRRACDIQGEWLAAVDAVELALTCCVPNASLQINLYEQLANQARRAVATPVGEFLAILAAQAPQTPRNALQRREVRKALAAQFSGEISNTASTEVIELLAVSQAQIMLDDVRLTLDPTEKADPEIIWTDLTYRDSRLASSVPAGRSLIAHPHRSAILLLDLAHEIGHAVVLQGPIGMRLAAYRTIINYAEFLLLDLAGGITDPSAEVCALKQLPEHDFAGALAQMQLRAATLADIERKVWRSWLEGVSLYVELLCDPGEDPTEISSIHEAIRSLIDFDIPRTDGEDALSHARRSADEANAQMEAFFKDALRLRSRPHHLAYFDDGHGVRRKASDLYVLGYLVVRSIVAAWERTLGQRLPPITASKLLVNATKAGLFEFYACPDERDEDFAEALQNRYLDWLDGLARLPAKTLDTFFEPVDAAERGRTYIWQDGVPVRVGNEIAAAQQYYDGEIERLQAWMIELASLASEPDEDGAPVHAEVLKAVFQNNIEGNRLLPIGSATARLLFLELSSGIGLSLRTYTPKDSDKPDRAVNSARYNQRFWTLPGGEEAKTALRRACGVAGTDRLYTTRIIDLIGHPDAPFESTGFSYLCSFLNGSLMIVRPSGLNEDITKSHPDFANVLQQRVFPEYRLADEEATVAKVSFLATRVLQQSASDDYARFAMDVSVSDLALSVAIAAAGKAFMPDDPKAFGASFAVAMGSEAYRRALALSLYQTGRFANGKPEAEIEGKGLTARLFSILSCSGITPYGAVI